MHPDPRDASVASSSTKAPRVPNAHACSPARSPLPSVFDIAFSEIVVIGVVALVVIGPERLPKVARTLGHMFGRLQRYVNDVKADISREMELDELRKLKSEVQSAANDLHMSITDATRGIESGMRSIESQLNDGSAQRCPAPEIAGKVDTSRGDRHLSAQAGAKVRAAAAVPPSQDPAPVSVAEGPVDAPRQAALPGFDRI